MTSTEQSRVTENATIAALVSLAARDGILTARTGRNGTDYVSVGTGDGVRTEDVKVGTLTKAQYGVAARVYVDVVISHVQGRTMQTTEHESVSDYWTLAICGAATTAASRRREDYDSCGQIRGTVAQVANGPEFLPGFVKVWRAWHLNDMTAACAHQVPIGQGTAERLENTSPCLDEDGNVRYRYGSARLLRELPSHAVQTVIAFLRQARGL